MVNTKGLMHEILIRVIGFIIFLLLLGIANLLTYYITSPMYLSVVSFLNTNIWLIIIFSVILLIGEIFGYLMFPLNIPSPLFNAVGGVLLIQFVFKLFRFLLDITSIKINFGMNIADIENIVIIIVFILVIIVGYSHIIIDATRPKKKHIQKDEKVHLKKKIE